MAGLFTNIFQDVLVVTVIGWFILYIYSNIRKQTMRESWEELKNLVSPGGDEA